MYYVRLSQAGLVFGDAFPQGVQRVAGGGFDFNGRDVVAGGEFAFCRQEVYFHAVAGIFFVVF